jgi:hypothetical protein
MYNYISEREVLIMNRNQLLEEMYDMACHNLLCYAKNHLASEPKEGFENEWKEASERAFLLKQTGRKSG